VAVPGQYNLSCLALDTFGVDGYIPKPHEKGVMITETEKLESELVEFLETDTVWCVARLAPR
jgi:hypothetical protein